MENKEILEGNKLIVNFMEFDVNSPNFEVLDTDCEFPHYRQGTIKDVKYYWSWDWLMPVVKKIGESPMGYEKGIRRETAARWKPIANELQNVNIEATWFCVVKFIEWQNARNAHTVDNQ